MKSSINILKIPFFIFLDISGILLGILLIIVGLVILSGWPISIWLGWLLLIIGFGAFLLHLGHYFDFKYMRRLFGDDYFLQK